MAQRAVRLMPRRFPRGDLHEPEFEFLHGKKQNESLWKIPPYRGGAGQFTQIRTGGRAEYELHVVMGEPRDVHASS